MKDYSKNIDKKGKTFYQNTKTGTITYDNPAQGQFKKIKEEMYQTSYKHFLNELEPVQLDLATFEENKERILEKYSLKKKEMIEKELV